MEKMNKGGKQLMHGHKVTPERIATYVPSFDMLRNIEEQWDNQMQPYSGRTRLYMGAPTFEEDVDRILNWLLAHHAQDVQGACREDSYFLFTGRHQNMDVDRNEHVMRGNGDFMQWFVRTVDKLPW